MMNTDAVLVINSGSSSLKLGLFQAGPDGDERVLMEVAASGVGHAGGSLSVKDAAGKEVHREKIAAGSQQEALKLGLQSLSALGLAKPVAVGHRIVHGGPHLLEHQQVTPKVLQTLKDSIHFAPLHIPAALKLIKAAEHAYPGVQQIACFDTTFHRTMPEAASHFPLPAALWDEGIRRYGFHGLSYESIVHALQPAIPARLIVAHLGNGCSVAAIQNGESVDTSMGLTPTGGVVMATRTGDIDPGVLLYLMRTKGMDADALESLFNKDSGLLALSGGCSDIRDVEKASDKGDARASLALEIFYRTIAKTIAGYASVLGGADLLVFTGGIGEHSQRTRQQICQRLKCIGVAPEGSEDTGTVVVRAMESGEDLQIARHTRRLST